MKDFIIVGHGLAAHVLMHTFKQNNISFSAIGSRDLSSCSRVAAGIWNPVVFKRATKSWLAHELISVLNIFYTHCEKEFGKNIITHRPIIKPFVEEQEKQLWVKKSNAELSTFIDPAIHTQVPPELNNCRISNGYGVVLQGGNLNVAEFLDLSTTYFKDDFIEEIFDHNRLQLAAEHVIYKSIQARHIIFCEGYRTKDNPYFDWIPLKPAKGEIITVRSGDLAFKNTIFNKNGFIMDLGGETFKAGATYEWQDLTDMPTEKGLEDMNCKIKEMISGSYSVVDHQAGVRPSSVDRRPIIGIHPRYKQLSVFNGLGTKGVMLAPYFAKNYVNFYLQKEALHPDVNVERFYHFYEG